VLVVATYRDVEVGRQHPLSHTLGELTRTRRTQRILLRGLAVDDVQRYIALSAGIDPPTDLVRAVQRETEGNPFFVTEVVRLLVAEGRLGPSATGSHESWSVSLPESVREVVGNRLSRLSDECNQVLSVASVIGREFSLALMERVTDREPDALLDLLDEAVRAQLVEELPTVGGYRFTHALVQETLSEELSTARRARLHRRVAEAIEFVHARDLSRYFAELAYHYYEAIATGSTDQAIDFAVKAAERAEEQVAFDEAVAQYQRALQILDLKARGVGPGDFNPAGPFPAKSYLAVSVDFVGAEIYTVASGELVTTVPRPNILAVAFAPSGRWLRSRQRIASSNIV
jgi:predicted ATPase